MRYLATFAGRLKYAGLVIASLSSAVGIFGEGSRDIGGHRVLTIVGYLSLGLTFFGLLISFLSQMAEDRQKTREQKTLALREIERTSQIILAGQLLVSLRVLWTFPVVDAGLNQKMQDGAKEINENALTTQGGVPQVPWEMQKYYSRLLPFLKHVIGTIPLGTYNLLGHPNGSTLFVILLDDAGNAVIPFGDLAPSESDARERSYSPHYLNSLSGVFISSKKLDPKRRILNFPEIVGDGTEDNPYTLSWTLDPVTLPAAVCKNNNLVPSTCLLPKLLKIAVLFKFYDLPVDGETIASIDQNAVWDGAGNVEPVSASDLLANSHLELSPNGHNLANAEYRFKQLYYKSLYYSQGSWADGQCVVLEFSRVEQEIGDDE